MQFPSPFKRNIQQAFGKRGEDFLAAIPSLIADVSRRWGVTDIQPVRNLSYNFVAFATTTAGDDVVLKIGLPNRELTSEMHTLKLFNGDGACRLLDCDEDRGFLLLERLKPGNMLANVSDDDERTRVFMDVLRKIHRPAAHYDDFIQLADWFAELKNIRNEFNGGVGPFGLLDTVEGVLPELFADEHGLIHGDLHHFNILSSERGWLAIDPKGVIGPAGYEVGPLMINPWDNSMDRTRFKVRAVRRVDMLCEGMGWQKEIIIKWSLAHAVLSAWWDYPNGDWEYSLRCGEIFSEIK